MGAVKRVGRGMKTFMIVFSFVVNVILVTALAVLASAVFDLKDQVAAPLLSGLHGSFVGLDEATIDWTIPVRDTIPVVMNIPLDTDTTVRLTEPVPLQVGAVITLPGVGTLSNAIVSLELPAGLELPVHLNLDVPVNDQLDVAMDVRAVIPLSETQLHDPFENLELLFAPLVRALNVLPSDWSEVGPFASRALAGELPALIAQGDGLADNWPGYSRTAGLGYTLASVPVPAGNVALETGIVPVGGISSLDALVRPGMYEDGGPEAINAAQMEALARSGVPAYTYDGSYAEMFRRGVVVAAASAGTEEGSRQGWGQPETAGLTTTTAPAVQDLGIVVGSPGG